MFWKRQKSIDKLEASLLEAKEEIKWLKKPSKKEQAALDNAVAERKERFKLGKVITYLDTECVIVVCQLYGTTGYHPRYSHSRIELQYKNKAGVMCIVEVNPITLEAYLDAK